MGVDEDAVGGVAGLLEEDGGGLWGGGMWLFSCLVRGVREEGQLKDINWDVEPLTSED